MRSPSSKKRLEGDYEPELVGANPHVTKHHATGAILKSERAGCQLVVVSVDGRLPVQSHYEVAAVRGDLVAVPPVARLEHDLRCGHLDDTAGSVCRIGPLIEDVHLITRRSADFARVSTTDEDAAIGVGRHPELEIEIEIRIAGGRQQETRARICGDRAGSTPEKPAAETPTIDIG